MLFMGKLTVKSHVQCCVELPEGNMYECVDMLLAIQANLALEFCHHAGLSADKLSLAQKLSLGCARTRLRCFKGTRPKMEIVEVAVQLCSFGLLTEELRFTQWWIQYSLYCSSPKKAFDFQIHAVKIYSVGFQQFSTYPIVFVGFGDIFMHHSSKASI